MENMKKKLRHGNMEWKGLYASSKRIERELGETMFENKFDGPEF